MLTSAPPSHPLSPAFLSWFRNGLLASGIGVISFMQSDMGREAAYGECRPPSLPHGGKYEPPPSLVSTFHPPPPPLPQGHWPHLSGWPRAWLWVFTPSSQTSQQR